jgi:hypothetical protein
VRCRLLLSSPATAAQPTRPGCTAGAALTDSGTDTQRLQLLTDPIIVVLTDPVIVAPSALQRAVVRASVPPLRFIISLSSDSYRSYRSLFARPSSTLRRRMYRRSSDAASACLLDFEIGDFIERVTLRSLLHLPMVLLTDSV